MSSVEEDHSPAPEEAPTPLLRVRNLHKRYMKGGESIEVLQGASLDVNAGELVSIIGKSGAGKSTLLHVLGTLDKPEQGSIHYNHGRYENRDLTGLSEKELADFRNHELGFVFQFHHLLPEFSALENVMMPVMIRREKKEDAARKAKAALDEVGLAHRMGHRPGELSGGEQQRVALARALVLDPPLVLADEVTGNLDAKTSAGIHELLFSLNASRGVTLLLVTHNQELADSMPRRLVLEDRLVKERG